jgi:DNA-binding IclR family transcriptional regulator
MSQSSPGVRRIVAILNFFAEHPGQAFTLTDLIRALKLSRATCHAMLTGLVEAGYLFRSHDKSYVLGPALAAVGRAADAGFSPLQIAGPEMRALADSYDAVCCAEFREGNDVVVRERAASVSHLAYSVPRGTRLPLRPPFAACYFAWSKPAIADAWLDQLTPPPTDEMRRRMGRVMDFARAHGFLFGVRNVWVEVSHPATDWNFNEEMSHQPITLLSALADDEEYRLGFLSAPVFDARGHVAFTLALQGTNTAMRGRDVARVGGEVRAACDRITRFIAGRQPGSD